MQPASKTVYALVGRYGENDSSFSFTANLRLKNHLWSNHESYFETASSYMAAVTDPNWRFLRLKNGSPKYDYCNSIVTSTNSSAASKLFIELTSEDKFEMVSFTNKNGSRTMVKRDIGWEEAFAFVLTNNRFRNEKWEIYKIAEGEIQPKNCQTKETLGLYVSTLKTKIIPLIADKKIAEAAVKALDEAMSKTAPTDGVAGIPVGVIDSRLSDVIREAALKWRKEHENEISKMEYDRYKLYQRLSDLIDETRNYIMLRGCAFASLKRECLDSKFSKLPQIARFDQTTLEQMQKTVHTLKRILDIPHRLESGELARKIILINEELKKIEDFFASFSAVGWLLSSNSSGPIKLTNCNFSRSCQALVKPDQNMWLDGAEVIDFMQAFYSEVLPLIPDPVNRRKMQTTVETAIREAGNLDGTPLSFIDNDISGQIKKALHEKSIFLQARKLALYQNLSDALKSIGETPLIGDWSNQGLPPFPKKLPPLDEISEEEMVKTAEIMTTHARARISPYGKDNRMMGFLNETVIPLKTEIVKWTKSHASVQNTLNYLKGQADDRIKIMAAGAVYGIGGYLIETGDVLISLPTEPMEIGSSLSMGKAAGINDSGNGMVQRDWEKVMFSWKARGILDMEQPYLSDVEKTGEVKFGGKKVPIKISRKLAAEINIPEFTRYLQDEIGRIPSTAPFGDDYLEKLAQYGISGIVVMPESFIWDCHCAAASALARKASAIFRNDTKAAIDMLKAAAAKFSYTPAGLYSPEHKLIILNADLLYERNAFLHEAAHADEKARKAAGILQPKVLKEMNRQQNLFIKNNPEYRFSTHTEVVNNSPNAAEERRADGLVGYWISGAALSMAAPDLYNYFLASTMALEAKEVKIKDTKGTRKETGLRLTTPKSVFSKPAGELVKWLSYNPFSSTYYLECLVRAGTQNRWVSTTGCRFLPEVK